MTNNDISILNDTLREILHELETQNRRGGTYGGGNNGYRPSYYMDNSKDKYYNEKAQKAARMARDKAKQDAADYEKYKRDIDKYSREENIYRDKARNAKKKAIEAEKKAQQSEIAGDKKKADAYRDEARRFRGEQRSYTNKTAIAKRERIKARDNRRRFETEGRVENSASRYERLRRMSQRNEAYSAFSSGRSSKIFGAGQNMQNIGGTMGAFGKTFGKVGGAVAKFGGLLTRFAGPIGMAIQALTLMRDAAVAVANALSKDAEFVLKEQKLQFEREKESAKITVDLAVENANAITDIRKKEIETEASYQVELAKLAQAEYLNAMETQLGSLMNGINKSVWAGYEKKVDIEAQKQTVETEQGFKRLQKENFIAERRQQNQFAIQEAAAAQYENTVKYQTASMRNAQDKLEDENKRYIASRVTGTHINGEGIDASGKDYDNTFFGTDRLVSHSGNAVTGQQYGQGQEATKTVMNHGLAGTVTQIAGGGDAANAWARTNMEAQIFERESIAETTKLRVGLDKQVNTAQLKSLNVLNETRAQYETEYQKSRIEFEKNIQKNWMKLAQHIETTIETYDKQGSITGIGLGIGTQQAMNSYKTYNMGLTATLARKFNIKPEDLFKLQNDYIETTGRNKFLNKTDYTKNLALGKYIGDYGVAQQLASSMEIFNHGVADSSDMVSEMVGQVTEMGLNGRKYTKELLKNIQLANKYHFKGGVKGLMEMAKWAMNTRFNMNSLGNMLEKIQDGGLENIITTGANMQVLGGGFAAGADPLAMGWEAFMDPARLAQRQDGQMAGIGTFNSRTGEVDFGIGDQMRLRQFAKLTGQDYEDVLNQRRQAVRGDKVNKYLNSGQNFSNTEKSLVTNKAKWNQETKQWQVDLLKDGQVTTTNVSNLTKEDLKFLNPETHDEKMENYMERMLSLVEKLEGINTGQNAELALESFQTYLGEYTKRGEQAEKTFSTNFENYVNNATKQMEEATKNYQGLMETIISKTEENKLDNITQKALDKVTEISTTVNDILTVLTVGKDAYKNMKDALKDQRTENNWAYQKFGFDGSKVKFDTKKRGWDFSATDSKYKSMQKNSSLLQKGINAAKKAGVNTVWYSRGNISLSDAEQRLATYQDAMELYRRRKEEWKEQNRYRQNRRGYDVTHDGGKTWEKLQDGFATANGKPMFAAAKSVVPINDGTVATSSPDDSAIFAKVGGPFDKLFNGVFDKIDMVYNSVVSGTSPSGGVVQPRAMIFGEEPRTVYNSVVSGTSPSGGGNIKIDPIKIELSGSLELTSGGQSVNIIDELKNNPLLLRSLASMLSDTISSKMNGGRSVNNGGFR